MVFSNAVFLFLFLPLTLIGYYLLKGKIRNYWLLLVSLVFYAWNKPSFLLILLASIFVNYVGALFVEKAEKQLTKKLLLWLTVGLNLGLLFYFKYFNFAVSIVERLFRRDLPFAEVILPIGISFFTFQGLSYVVDVYRGDVLAQRNPFKLGMYISLFPQLVAGPIVRYKDVAAEIDERSVTLEDFVYGVRRFILGLFKKIIIADTLAVAADGIFGNASGSNTVLIAWIGIISYSLQLFFDFSGYSDMAIGMGRMFGFHFLENFNYPYISKSITEFWRRWHISLSSFFRDYVYIPLGGNRKRVYLNVSIVFLLTGVWHGAAFSFILWGIWHGVFNLAERFFRSRSKDKPETTGAKAVLSGFFAHVYTLLVVMIGWVFFRAEGLRAGWEYLLSMFGLNNDPASQFATVYYYLDKWTVMALILGIAMATPMLKQAMQWLQRKLPEPAWDIASNLVLLGTLLLCVLQVAANTYSAFIYFQF